MMTLLIDYRGLFDYPNDWETKKSTDKKCPDLVKDLCDYHIYVGSTQNTDIYSHLLILKRKQNEVFK